MRRFLFLAVLLFPGLLAAQSSTKYSKNTYGETTLTGTVVQVDAWSGTGPTTDRTVRITWNGNSTSTNGVNAPPLVTLNVNSGLVASIGNDASNLGAKAGTYVGTVQFTSFNGKLRAYLQFLNDGGRQVFFYADQNFQYTLALSNPRNVRVIYEVMQAGNLIGTYFLEPGQSIIQTVHTTDDSSLTVNEKPFQIVNLGGGDYSRLPGTVVTSSTTVTPSQSGTTPTTITPSTPPAGSGFGTAPKDTAGGTVPPDTAIWDNKNSQSPALSDQVYKQGVAQIVSAVRASGGGGGGTTDLTPVVNKLEEIKQQGQVADTAAAEFADETSVTFDATEAQVSGIESKMPTPPVITAPGSFSGTMSLSLAMPGAGVHVMSINLAQWATAINVFKTVVRGALAIWFFFMVVRALKQAFA